MTGVKTAERGPATGQEIEAVQKQLRAVRPNPTTPGDSAAAKQARGIIDEVLAGLPDEAILNGDAAAFRQNILAGRGNTAAMYRMRALDAADECADLNASTAYSGGNVENAGRQSFKSLVRPPVSGGPTPAAKAGFNAAEQAAIRNVAAPGLMADTLRAIGKFAPTDAVKGYLSAEAALQVGACRCHSRLLHMVPRNWAMRCCNSGSGTRCP